jgi:hypothetical protein
MYSISEIRKQNAQKKADFDNARDGTFCTLQGGGILLRHGARSKTIDDHKEANEFLERVRGKSTALIRDIVISYFTPVLA